MRTIDIGGRLVGAGCPCYLIAEAGVNHNGDPDAALRLVDAAAAAGVDAVKFQTFAAERLATATAPKANYQLETTDRAESQLDMLRRLELSADAHRRVMAHCSARGVQFLSTPYDEESADFLDVLGVAAFKIGSGEIVNWPFLQHVARKGRPMIVSTGTTYLSEVDEAARTIADAGNDQLVLLHCVSRYPADPATANLRAMQTMAQAFPWPVGFSDHSLGIEVGLAAAALGARVIEKHFTLDRTLPGPDHKASLEPAELAELVKGIRKVESALGDGIKRPVPAEEEGRKLGHRGLVAVRDLPEGYIIERADLRALRTGTGISVKDILWVVGRRLARAVEAGRAIERADLT